MSPLTESLLLGGLVGALPWWGYLTIGIVLTHILVMSVSLYLHRAETHLAAEIHPALAVVFRALFWLSQTSTTKEWVAIHRKHHHYVDKEDDPHSPKYHSLWKMLFATAYRKEAKNKVTLALYGRGTPEDWLEKNVFTRYRRFGVVVLAIAFISLFGLKWGAVLWVVQVTYLPIVASFGVNGLGHLIGYRNAEMENRSRNVLPFDFLACGEFLHNNHHADPKSAKFSFEPWETDLGWGWLKLFEWLGLAKVRWVYRPPITPDQNVTSLRDEAVEAFVRYLPYIKRKFHAKVCPALKKELDHPVALTRAAWLELRFSKLCEKTSSIKTLKHELRLWLDRARSINNEKLRDFCDWLIMIRVPASPT